MAIGSRQPASRASYTEQVTFVQTDETCVYFDYFYLMRLFEIVLFCITCDKRWKKLIKDGMRHTHCSRKLVVG